MNKSSQFILQSGYIVLKRYPFVRWVPMLLMMGIIFILSARQNSELPHMGWWDLYFKKGAHMLGYGMLAVFTYWGTRHWLAALIITILYAISDEFHQTLVPTRTGQPRDVLIDTAGALIGFVVYRHWLQSWLITRIGQQLKVPVHQYTNREVAQ